MKKISIYFLSIILSLGYVVGMSSDVSAANTNNFVVNSYKIDYYLNKDSEGRSTLRAVEKIEAEFPSFDQNHGIERAIPITYNGHSTSLKILSVTNTNGTSVSYTTYQSGGNDVLRIGNADEFVHGTQSYVITYDQRDVTRYFKNTKSDEFYWDTNGTEWAVPIKLLSVLLHLEGNLSAKLSGNQQCYFGSAGANANCILTASSDGFSVEVSNVKPYENVTIATGFQAQTFAAYKTSPLAYLVMIWFTLIYITAFLAVILAVVFFVRFFRKWNRRGELGTIIPEYIPPKDASVTVAASIFNKQQTAFSAQLIDFAVRHYVKIYQTREKSLFKSAQYELEIIKDISDLRDEEQEIIRDIFPGTDVGTRLDMEDMKKDRMKLYLSLSDNEQKLDKNIKGKYGLRAKDPIQSAWFKKNSVIVLVLAVITLSPWLLFVSLIGFVLMVTLAPLTDKGLALLRYLEGLKMYIKVAEVDRIKMLQSPEGAAKLDAPIDTNDSRQLVTLYERVLPYAILFGQEKEWNTRLGQYYESINSSPDWYVGSNAVFNAAVFSSAISSFNSVATYSNPTSSSSGGSGGGGSSGGGGGGGGGGGW